jgi:hypothetical protein
LWAGVPARVLAETTSSYYKFRPVHKMVITDTGTKVKQLQLKFQITKKEEKKISKFLH